jgi:hypothetical protein
MRIYRSCGIHIMKIHITTRRLSSTPETNRTGVPRDNGIARYCAAFGDSPNGEERSDELLVTWATSSQDCSASGNSESSANLSLEEDGPEGIFEPTLGDPWPKRSLA